MEENRENSIETARVIGKPFKEGESGNPNGRPKGQRNYATIYREALIKIAELNQKNPEDVENEMISSGILNARKGDYRFYKDVLDRLYGQPTQKTETNLRGELKIEISEDIAKKYDTSSNTETNSTE